MARTTSASRRGGAALTTQRVLDRIAKSDVELIRFLWVDHNGICRGKAVSRRHLADRMESGIGLAKVRQAANLLDQIQPVPGFNAVGEVRLVPDPGSFVELPHAPGSAAMLCDLIDVDGQPWGACPRQFLKDAIASAAALGLEAVAAFEPEFTLCQQRPVRGHLEVLDDSLCFDNVGFDQANAFAVALSRQLAEQGIDVELYHPEFGAGQHEMTVRHAPALKAADAHVWQRAMTRGLAHQQGLWATFAPIPHPGFRGNGNHMHVSLWRDGANAFADAEDRLGLSRLAYHFIGGLLAHAPALVALSCASVNSYRRLKPRMWSGGHCCYGLDNREAAVRVPSRLRGREAASTNIEFKPCDATANPYLALGALLLAGLDGVRRGLEPGEPMADDPNELSEEALRQRGIRPLPASLEEAITALEGDALLSEALGPLRRVLYPAIKRSDVQRLRELNEAEEFYLHATRY
ncbi:glutamine synthetase [Myxococcaceae bacterium JPH2]|nr:glutamine synthetase [Myxococcaceae bacterium JPH2]